MIPEFPIFEKLSLKHEKEIEEIESSFLPFSDFNFTSMWTYNTDESIEVSKLYGNLVVKFVDYLTLKPFYSFIGNNKPKETVEELLELSRKNCFELKLKLIPDFIAVSEELADSFIIQEDRDNFDYIVSASDIASLNPEKYERKIRQVAQFKEKYPEYEVKQIKVKEEKIAKEIFGLFEEWEVINGKDRTETENELKAIHRLLDSLEYNEGYGLGIYFQEKLIGFNIYEKIHNNYGISAFQKGDKRFSGIYALLSQEVAKHLVSLGCEYINYEQDLGIEGLRLSKTTWKPVFFLKKYSIEPKN